LQKVLARAGVGSRRACEELIQEGRVEVDGKVVTKLGTRVDVTQQKIRVDGEEKGSTQQIYYMVNKPPGVVSTNRDPAGRMRVIDLINSDMRLFPVGRLDRTSEGLIIVTNDGELANRLTHPRYQVSKTYLVRVAGRISFAKIQELGEGTYLAEGFVQPESISIKRHRRQSTDLEIVLREGRNREIRRLLARAGHKVINLCRIAVGTIKLGSLPSGSYRKLTLAEIRKLESLHTDPAQKGSSGSKRSASRRSAAGSGRKKTTGGKASTRSKARGKTRAVKKKSKSLTGGARKRASTKGRPRTSKSAKKGRRRSST
jgi:23S rRNA pseudouridine2605 synthase